MKNSVKAILVIVVLCLSLVGLLSIFEIIPKDQLPKLLVQLFLAAGVLLGAAVVLGLLSKSGGSDKTEPPPTL